jgi:c-di-GMP-binding flagellar brake protein YcgR
MSEALIPVRKTEIAVGKPLPWAVYDANHVLLLNAGVVVTSQSQLEALQEKGLFREARPRPTSHRDMGEEQAQHDDDLEGGTEMPFDRAHLQPGDLLQLQALQAGVEERYNVRLIGLLKGKSVLVTHPLEDGKLIFVREGHGYLVRAFSGVHVCGFQARVLKVNLTPYAYLHLSYPQTVRALRLRKAMRVPVDIIVAVYDREGGKLLSSGRMVDLSAGGARIHALTAFGEPGARIVVSFKFKLEAVEEIVTAPAHVRSVGDETDDKGRPVKVLGVQFDELSPSQRLMIMNLVYQQLFKEV